MKSFSAIKYFGVILMGMEGFFPLTMLNAVKAPTSLLPKCGKCKLHRGCKTPKMPYTGNGKKGILIIGEAPGCISGESLVQTAFRDKSIHPDGIPIKDLVGKKDFYVYSFDVEEQKMALGKVNKVWKTGRKKIWEVVYEWKYASGNKTTTLRDSLRVTSNHPFLLKRRIKHDPFKGWDRSGTDYLSLDQGLCVGDSIQPFHQRVTDDYSHVGAFSNDMKREGAFLLSFKEGRELNREEHCHHANENKLDDSWGNLELLNVVDHARHHTTKNNPMQSPEARTRHKEAMADEEYRKGQSARLKSFLSDPIEREKRLNQIHRTASQTANTLKEKYKDPQFYFNYLVSRKKFCAVDDAWVARKFKEKFPDEEIPIDNHKIVEINYIGVKDVYDMEVEKYHNFAVNGIFVHNSTEDQEGRQFVGITGKMLRRSLRKFGIDVNQDCWLDNSLRCHPPDNIIPDEKMVLWCRPNVLDTIEETNPAVIILLGKRAVKSVIGHYWKEDIEGVKRWAGWQIPNQKPNCWICPTYHPSYIMRDKWDKELYQTVFDRHLKNAVDLAGTRPWKKPPDFESEVECVYDVNKAARMIRKMISMGGVVAFDYETTSLKPDSDRSEIVCCSVCWEGKKTIAYPWQGEAIQATRELLLSPLGKIASNLKFEERWSKRHLGISVNNWKWDTMQMAHVLDSRRGITSIKFQSYVLLGQGDYDGHLKPFLESKEPGGNALNRVREIDLGQLLLYNGLDALLEYRVAEVQMKKMGVR